MRALDATWRKSTRSNINGACVEARCADRAAWCGTMPERPVVM